MDTHTQQAQTETTQTVTCLHVFIEHTMETFTVQAETSM